MPSTDTATLIDAFHVAPEADDAFIADWVQARDDLRACGACQEIALHRALRRDVEPRFVSVGRVTSAQAWEQAVSDPAFPGVGTTLYEVVREHGTPDLEGGVVLIDLLAVPDGQEEQILVGWERARAVLDEQRGYIGTRLHHSLGRAEHRFVDIARWSSPLMFARALQRPDFQQVQPLRSQPALYQVVRS